MNPDRFKWKARLYPAAALFAGLVAAQIIATVQVFLANQSLYDTITAIGAAGYLVVPNHRTMVSLQELTTALCGGLFLTLSAGAGICVLSLGAAWLWDRVCRRKGALLVPLLLLWAGLTAGANWKGVSPFTILYLTVIPPVVFATTLSFMPRVNKKRPWRNGLLHLVPIIVLGFVWAPQLEKGLFINIRDYLLLSNPVTGKVVDFYYRYTLYPAQALKPLHRKLLKTCNLEAIPEGPDKKELLKTLLAHDWMETTNRNDVGLKLFSSDNMLLLDNGRGTLLKISRNEFLARPAGSLKRFSSVADRHAFFRQFTFYSLLMGFPITLYIFLYSLVFLILGRWIETGIASQGSAAICFSAGLLLLMPLWQVNGEETAGGAGLPGSHKTHEELVDLLESPSPLVASKALSALGRGGEKKAIIRILRYIKVSDHWYAQLSAYTALKALGWRQERSLSAGPH